jgi:hypothetical protein
MPLPIDILEQALGQYLSLFRDCFSQPTWQHFVSKVDLAEEVIRTFETVPGTRTHVLMDSWYTCRRLWRLALVRD